MRGGGQGQEKQDTKMAGWRGVGRDRTESGEETWLWWEHRDQAEGKSNIGGERRMGNNGQGEEGMQQMEIGEKWELGWR